MRQEHIEAFLEIIKTKNVSKAAANLHLSQSAVSNYLKALEEELGLQLVARYKGYRSVELTPYGEEFIPLAENWMNLQRQMESLRRNSKLELTIGALDSLNSNILYPVCSRLIAEHKDLHISVRTAPSVDLYKAASTGIIDIGFASYDAVFPNVLVSSAFSEKMCVVRNKRGSNKAQITHPSELLEENAIQLQWGADFEAWRNCYWDSHIHARMEVDTVSMLRRSLEQENCWAVMPRIDWDSGLMRYGDQPPFIDLECCELGEHNPPERKVYKLQPRYTKPYRQMAVDLFLDALRQQIGENPELNLYEL